MQTGVEVLCSDPSHPVWPRLVSWTEYHHARLVSSSKELTGGDILFLVSCSEIIGPEIRNRYRKAFTLHASALPKGRGWSPHIWAIIEGQNDITVSLIEADDPVDSGRIWRQVTVHLEGHELYDEINRLLFDAETNLMYRALSLIDYSGGTPQEGEATQYRKRTPEDSRLDPDKSIAEQFDLLRVCDPDRFPAFVEIRGHRYNVTLSKPADPDHYVPQDAGVWQPFGHRTKVGA